jgi:GTP-binding protein
MADIPGIIEGASSGAGLGLQFLKHLERTRIFLHLIDISGADPEREPIKDFQTIEAELKQYGEKVSKQQRWVVLNKVDLVDNAALEIFRGPPQELLVGMVEYTVLQERPVEGVRN